MIKTATAILLCSLLLTASRATSADNGRDDLDGQWSLRSMTSCGIEIPEEYLRQTSVSIVDDQLILDKSWRVACKNPIDPVTRSAEGYLEGYPGTRFTMIFGPHDARNEIDLVVSGLVPAEEEADLRPNTKVLLQQRSIRCQGLYKREGNKLTLCWADWEVSRPTDFTGKGHPNRTLIVLERIAAE